MLKSIHFCEIEYYIHSQNQELIYLIFFLIYLFLYRFILKGYLKKFGILYLLCQGALISANLHICTSFLLYF